MNIEKKIGAYLEEANMDIEQMIDDAIESIKKATDEVVKVSRKLNGNPEKVAKDAIRDLNNASGKLSGIRKGVKREDKNG